MTRNELIAELQRMPEDCGVVFMRRSDDDDGVYFNPIVTVRVFKPDDRDTHTIVLSED